MNSDIFNTSQELAERQLILLKEAQSLFPKSLVSRELLSQGLTTYKGVVVPMSSVSHRYLYDFYDQGYIDAFIVLFEAIFNEKVGKMSEFGFRTLLEMGVEEGFILFDPNVETADKNIYTLFRTLVDYFSIETSMQGVFREWFSKLYLENRQKLKQSLSQKRI